MIYSIEYTTGPYYTEVGDYHRWFAVENGERIGELYVTIDTETISNITVNEDRRGEGIARALYEAADARLDNLLHDLPAHRTPEGDAFAQAMGGEEATECHIDYCVCSDAA
ncbi:acetyltransferase (GNAT) family protein [Brevibacterium sanguinis]|uniref:Acetyltransferase (GNAT) family protein n=2 Tax=Brevibacterium TaxID=1696 RepID=A0A366ILM7_9MICO|nr:MULTISPECIES: GNAT family N-acetyltransferase [Brevibacterium]RBP66456.1 acetyltransferase (GNAT) family protein [Brevibacterium sanguinis]RBP73108.1 acetyltransferase (GNAT) family protein [Brevibacterium celere]